MAKIGDFVMNKPPHSNMTVTLHLKFTRMFHLRLWLGKVLIRAACWLWNTGVEFKMVEDGRDHHNCLCVPIPEISDGTADWWRAKFDRGE